MTQTAKDMTNNWKLARYQQIKKLFAGGVSKEQLVKRFGALNVNTALGKNGWIS